MFLSACLCSTGAFAETLVEASGTVTGVPEAGGKYYVDYDSKTDLQEAAKELSIRIASEGFTLLKNEGNALPLNRDAQYVTLFGMHSVSFYSSTTGSAGGSTNTNGIAETTLQMSMEDAGYKVNPRTIKLYDQYTALGTINNELPVEYYSPADKSTFQAYNDAAVIVFSRQGSEAADKITNNMADHANPDDHELMLDDNEKALIKMVKEHYADSPIIVVINSSNILQIPELNEPKATSEYGVDAILWVGNTGNNGVAAIGKILSGEVNPSGHTVEVWERDFTQGPTWTNFGFQSQNKDENGNRMNAFYYHNGEATKYATVEYREGIYLGYKYYETRYDDAAEADKEAMYNNVLYPFGYGLSYTTFDWELAEDVALEDAISAPNETITVKVKVTNTGDVAGKDVVQIYANPPYTSGGIEKASANLMGFAKTRLLQPGESEIVTIQFVAQDMASFDWNDANENGFTGYELEAGSYGITARRNSHDVVLSINRKVADGFQCDTDYTSGSTIEARFVDDYTTVKDSLLDNMISRSTGLTQPKAASVEDRTIDDEYFELIEKQKYYHSVDDDGDEPWYLEEDGLPETWDQVVAEKYSDRNAPIQIQQMQGVDFTLDIVDGAVVQGEDEGSKKWEAFMNQLTWEELCSLVQSGGATLKSPIAAVGVREMEAIEGPLQFQGQTLWVCPAILAATWNTELAYKEGIMIGNEALYNGEAYWNGPSMNIHRSPLTGRNVEYYSQDGVHGGLIACAVVEGVTSKGVTCYIKHMAVNDQESYRDSYGGVFTWVTEQAMREIYFKSFEYSLKQGHSTGVMSSYNRIGNINSALNYPLHQMAHQEWGSRAIFETDAWQTPYVPLDLMVRAGDNQVLGIGMNYPDVDLEVGTWNPEEKIVYVSDGAGGTYPNATQYANVRKAAQEVLYVYANSAAVKNGYLEITEPTVMTFDINASEAVTIAVDGLSYSSVSLKSGELPEGLTLAETGVISGTATEYGTTDIVVSVIADGYIELDVPVRIEVVNPIHDEGTALNAYQVGSAAETSFSSPYYAYGATVNFNMPGYWSDETLAEDDLGMQTILNWYHWKDTDILIKQEPGSNQNNPDNRLGHLVEGENWDASCLVLPLADIQSGNYVKAYLYGYSISEEDASKLAEYGLHVEKMSGTREAYSKATYDYESGMKIVGTPSKAGEVEITVNLQVPAVGSFWGNFPNFKNMVSPHYVTIERVVTISIAE